MELAADEMTDIYFGSMYAPAVTDVSDHLLDMSAYPVTDSYTDQRLREVTDDGHIYMLPLYYSVLGITYNKTLLDEHGWTLPTSLEELEAQARKAALPPLELEPQTEEKVDFDTFCKSDFRAVKVKDCQAVKKSNKLLRFTLDDGTGTDRQILSGIAKWYKPEDLMGKTLMAIVNLPPRKMMGLESNGMLISAVHTERGEERLNLLMLDDKIPAGAKMC